MSKVLYFLVVVAVIAQVYGGAVAPENNVPTAEVEKAAGGAAGEVKKVAGSVENAAGQAEKFAAGSTGVFKPFVDGAVAGSEKLVNDFVEIPKDVFSMF